MKYPCPCCEEFDFGFDFGTPTPYHGNFICEICGWDEDPYQVRFPNEPGANLMSLNEARQAWRTMDKADYVEWVKNYPVRKIDETCTETKYLYLCPCCEEFDFDFGVPYPGPYGGFGICEICGWHDDDYQLYHPDDETGANKMSLNEAREIWASNKGISRKPLSLNEARRIWAKGYPNPKMAT